MSIVDVKSLNCATTINDARKTPTQYVQERAEAHQKEYGSCRELNDVCNLIDSIHLHLPYFAVAATCSCAGTSSQRMSFRSSTNIEYSTGTRMRVTKVAMVRPPICA